MEERVGACGVYCSFCPTFTLERNKCLGCEWANRMLRKSRENHKGCIFFECAQTKNVECCFQCKEFPCETHYDPKEAVYTKQALDMWKELRKTGLTFSGKRKKPENSQKTQINISDLP